MKCVWTQLLPGTHCIGGLVGPRASLNNFWEEKNLLPPLGFETQIEHNNNTVFIVVMRSAYTISEHVSQWACNILFQKIQSSIFSMPLSFLCPRQVRHMSQPMLLFCWLGIKFHLLLVKVASIIKFNLTLNLCLLNRKPNNFLLTALYCGHSTVLYSYCLCTYTVGTEVHFPCSLFNIYYFHKGLNKICIC